MKVFETPNRLKALWQIFNTLIPYLGLVTLAFYSQAQNWPMGLTIFFSALAGLVMTRLFIFFHDCCHGSFFKSRKANSFWGTLFGIITATPYSDWRRSHGIHHNTSGNLDLRGVGDVWTMTLAEFEKAKPGTRLLYRIYRNPLFLFIFIPPILFLILHRFPSKVSRGREHVSVIINNLGMAGLVTVLGLNLGWLNVLGVILPLFYTASVFGVWLFYVQHQFDPGYWERKEAYSDIDAALVGSSHYKLPKILQWLSGNIGLHHIHHLKPRIPNYNLQACYDSVKELQVKDPLTIWTSFRSLTKNLWDEGNKRLLSFRQARVLKKA